MMDISNAELDGLEFSHLEHLVLGRSEDLTNLDFLQRMPELQHLNMRSCWKTRYHLVGLRHATKLRVLKLDSIIPAGVSHISNFINKFYKSH